VLVGFDRILTLFEELLPPDLGNDIEKIRQCREAIIERAGNDQELKRQLINANMNPLVEDFLCGIIVIKNATN